MKVVFVSGMLPSGHYSTFIANGIYNQINDDLIVYSDQRPKNLEIKGCGVIKPVWSKSWKFAFEILKELRKDQPDVIHFQHELNMYGGSFTALMFPLFMILLKLLGYKIVVTVHASVFKKQVNDEFITAFHQDSPFLSPGLIKLIFQYIYYVITNVADTNIVHTYLAKKILTQDYGAPAKKINVIPIAIPQRKIPDIGKDPYFFYFGYMVRRKGLGFLLDGYKKFLDNNPNTPYKLVLAGGKIKGQEAAYDEIIDMISKFKLKDRIEVKGFIEQDMQDDLYEKAYAVCIPALISMGSSGPLFHSNSYGKCVVTSNIGHFVEDIIDNETGILTSNKNWHKALEKVAKNPDLVKKIEKNVIEKAKSRSPNDTAKKYMSLYKKIIS